jgi:hypothetical protein
MDEKELCMVLLVHLWTLGLGNGHFGGGRFFGIWRGKVVPGRCMLRCKSTGTSRAPGVELTTMRMAWRLAADWGLPTERGLTAVLGLGLARVLWCAIVLSRYIRITRVIILYSSTMVKLLLVLLAIKSGITDESLPLNRCH